MGRAAAADPYRPGPPHALGTFMTTSAPPAVFSSISEVERDVGIAKETLRVWERRYGFPAPQRDPNGERVYPPEQVHKLVLVKRLIDQGYRPGKIMALEVQALAELGGKPVSGPAARGLDDPEIVACLDLLRAHKLTELRQRLSQAMLTMGMKRCVIELIAPLTTAVGLAWSQGSLAVFEEHLYADMLQTVLRNAIVAATAQRSDEPRPRVLLTTVPQERHSLGLLMAEVLLALDGAASISLGVQTPWPTSSRQCARSRPTSWPCRFRASPRPAPRWTTSTSCAPGSATMPRSGRAAPAWRWRAAICSRAPCSIC